MADIISEIIGVMFEAQLYIIGPTDPPPIASIPRPRTAEEQVKVQIAIDAGIKEAIQQNDLVLAAVLQQLYEESLHYHVRADLLDATISGESTEREYEAFISYVEATRKSIKAKCDGTAGGEVKK